MIIVVDIDGTLVNNDGKLTDYTIEVFKKCKKAGHIVVLNSGRSYIDSQDIAKSIGADYINCFYGNLLVDNRGNILHSRAITKDTNKQLFADIELLKPQWHAMQTFENALSDNIYVCKKYNGQYKDKNSLQAFESYNTIIGLSSEVNEFDKIKSIAQSHNLDTKFVNDGQICAFFPKEARKWLGIEKLLKHLNISNEQVIAFGDHMSDYETLKNSKIGVAVANSEKVLLEKIKTHTLSNQEDGTAKYLEENIL